MSDNTVRLIGYYDRAPFVCLVTEFCARGTLAAFAARNRALCRALARRFTLELGLLFFENCSHITVLHHPQHNTTQHNTQKMQCALCTAADSCTATSSPRTVSSVLTTTLSSSSSGLSPPFQIRWPSHI